MKKVFLILVMILGAVGLKAQSLEFLGLPLETTSKAAFAEMLTQKGYKYHNEMDGYVMYVGQFLGMDASVMLVPNSDDGVTALVISMDNLNPVKMGQIFGDLVQRYMKKYADFKYNTEVTHDGKTQMMFRKNKENGLTDFVTLENKVANGGCSVSITYACNLQTTDNNTSQTNGISLDDI